MRIFEKYLANIQNCLNKVNTDVEFEVKFGKFNGKRFHPQLSLENYITIQKFLKSYKFVEHNQLVKYYNSGIRVIEENGYKNVIKKEKIENIDLQEYDIRFSLSSETIITTDNSVVTESPSIVSKRNRQVYSLDSISIELSSCIIEDKISYDIEIEVKDTKLPETLNKFLHFTEQILKIIQNSEVIMTKNDISIVKNGYLSLINKKSFKFIGNQPVSVTKDRILKNEMYAATVKLDGDRNLLFIYNGNCYIINKRFTINNIQISIEGFDNTIIDTELYSGKFYCFDIIYYKNEDLGGNKEYFLNKRLSLIKDIVSTINNENFVTKEYSLSNDACYSMNFYQLAKFYIDKVIDNYQNTKIDGIIFIPVNRAYPSENEKLHLKWKNDKDNTIDFKIKKINHDEEIWELYCYDSVSEDVLFSYPTYDKIHRVNVNKRLARKFKDNSVIEFYYDKFYEKFIPLRYRPDKTRGNYIDVARDIFKLILYPFNFSIKTIRNDERFLHYMKRYSLAFIKDTLDFNKIKYIGNEEQDIIKFIDSNTRYVSFDVLDSCLLEKFKEKYQKLRNYPTNKNFDYTIKSYNNNYENYTFNSVVCYDMNSFYESKDKLLDFINNITLSLDKSGYLILFVINYDKIKGNLPCISYDGCEFNIQSVGDSDTGVFGKKIQITYKNEFVDANEVKIENAISATSLIKTLTKKHIFELVMNVSAEDIYYNIWKINGNYLSNIEKAYTFLYNILIFKNN